MAALRFDMLMPFQNSSRLPRRPAGFLADDAAVLDMDDPVGERHEPRIVGDDQHAAARVLGDVRQDTHDGLAVLAVQRGGRLVGQDHRRIADDRARNRHPLLFAAAELARIVPGLAGQADPGQRRARLVLARPCRVSPRTSSASRTLSAADSVGNR